MKTVIWVIAALVSGVVIIYSFKSKSLDKMEAQSSYTIIRKWDLPEVLQEISGIAWMTNDLIAAVQDEDGKIFIYNLKTSELEKTIPFAEGGDYEGIAIVENTAFVLRSDGVIFEVADFQGKNPRVQKHVTRTKQLAGINIEALTSDPQNNRLLLGVKERNGLPERREIYSFDLDRKNSGKEPLYVLNMKDEIFAEVNEKMENILKPGAIAIHPHSREHYILDGTNPKLLITGVNGEPKELFMLPSEDFGNPEGLTFSPEGDFYISNEAEDDPATILQITFDRETK